MGTPVAGRRPSSPAAHPGSGQVLPESLEAALAGQDDRRYIALHDD
jgi:hypothetical protein